MSVNVYIPTPFRRATNNQAHVSMEADDVAALLDGLETRFSGLRGLMRDDKGEVHRHVNIYVNSEAIESLKGLDTTLKDGDEVSIIPALAGGSTRSSMDAGRDPTTPDTPAHAAGGQRPEARAWYRPGAHTR
jgi:sulfur-carrier protein